MCVGATAATVVVLASMVASTLPTCALAGVAVDVAATNCSNWSVRFNQSIEGVCVCTATNCDTVSNDYLSLGVNEAGVYQTSKAGDRLTYSTIAVTNTAAASVADIVLDTTVRYQKIVGFGGAFTDSASLNVYKMDATVQQQIVDAYFSETGLQYTLGRIPIASTDFSSSIYSYNSVVDDFDMTHFSIDVDKAPQSNKLTFIQRALAATRTAQRNLTLFASSWAPPAWMTTENSTLNAKLKGEPGEPYWKALALYYSKFISAYEAEGVKIWALTTQNEPIQQPGASKVWQSLRFNTTTERDFIKRDLGPLLKANNPTLKLIILDDQKDEVLKWTAALADPEARQYIWGIGVHWYKNLDFVNDALGDFDKLTQWHEAHADLSILATEACEGSLVKGLGTGVGVRLLEPAVVWKRGENYGRDIIGDLSNFATGWTDWNLVLDTTGGPTWVDNLVDAPILVDEVGKNEFYKQPMYYVMGHFSKFLPAGSVRIALNVTDDATSEALRKIDRVAFVTPSDHVVLILQNRDAVATTLRIRLANEQLDVMLTLPGNTIQTILVGAGSNSSDETTRAPVTSVARGYVHVSAIGVVLVAVLVVMHLT